MNVEIEVVAAEGIALMAGPTVKTQKVTLEVRPLFGVAATSILRYLRQGRSSLSAVSPDYTFEGGLAVA